MSSRRRSTRRRNAAPPNLTTLLILLVILAAFWAYEEGYFDRWLGGESAPPVAEAPPDRAPEQIDGSEPESRSAPEPVVPQPAVPPIDAPPPEDAIETDALRGYAGSWYQVYFTKPRYPERTDTRFGGLDETIAADIDGAEQRVDLVVFDLSMPRIGDALLRAHGRGVAVRVVVDSENVEKADVAVLVGELQAAGVPVFQDERRAFMHNKFIVIDEVVVWTGSANFTANDIYRNNNNMLRIIDERLAQNYTAKADDLFGGGGGPGGGSVVIHPELEIDGAQVRTMFSPEDPVTRRIIERIDGAQQRVDMMAFAFTSDPIAEALVAARQRGVAVRGVMENRNARGTGSDFELVLAGGVDMHTDGNCYIMHHKVIVIDGRTVITGSFNFTRAAQEQNDENVLIIDDASLAARYHEEFERVYGHALEPTRCG
jgi:phosphatidylserine/phosphatidylglycerophosphate/cardiolipin synthase-like enzyme